MSLGPDRSRCRWDPPPGFREFPEMSVPRNRSRSVKNHRARVATRHCERKLTAAMGQKQTYRNCREQRGRSRPTETAESKIIRDHVKYAHSMCVHFLFTPCILISKRCLGKVSKEQMNLEKNQIAPLEVKYRFSIRAGF